MAHSDKEEHTPTHFRRAKKRAGGMAQWFVQSSYCPCGGREFGFNSSSRGLMPVASMTTDLQVQIYTVGKELEGTVNK